MKDYRQIDINEWKQVGAGYNGQAFVSDNYPGMLLKISRTDMGTKDKIEHEFFDAKTAYNIGLPTPKVFEIVRDGNDYGYISQKIEGKKSIARLCADEPERIPEFAALMAKVGKELHQTHIELSEHVVSMKGLLQKAVAISPLLTDEQRELLSETTDAMPETGMCLHGDFQVGNLIVADGKHYWIDLGWLSQGYYMMDLAHLYKMMMEESVLPPVQNLTHMSREQMVAFWNSFAKAYVGQEDITALNEALLPYVVLDIVRSFYLHSNDDPRLLAYLRQRVIEDMRNFTSV